MLSNLWDHLAGLGILLIKLFGPAVVFIGMLALVGQFVVLPDSFSLLVGIFFGLIVAFLSGLVRLSGQEINRHR